MSVSTISQIQLDLARTNLESQSLQFETPFSPISDFQMGEVDMIYNIPQLNSRYLYLMEEPPTQSGDQLLQYLLEHVRQLFFLHN